MVIGVDVDWFGGCRAGVCLAGGIVIVFTSGEFAAAVGDRSRGSEQAG